MSPRQQGSPADGQNEDKLCARDLCKQRHGAGGCIIMFQERPTQSSLLRCQDSSANKLFLNKCEDCSYLAYPDRRPKSFFLLLIIILYRICEEFVKVTIQGHWSRGTKEQLGQTKQCVSVSSTTGWQQRASPQAYSEIEVGEMAPSWRWYKTLWRLLQWTYFCNGLLFV